MPSRNTIRLDTGESYYHVYARGASKQPIFLEPKDYTYFLKLFERYLSDKTTISKQGIAYPNFKKSIQVLAYCLMPNHFHILVYQAEQGGLTALMRGIMTSYSRYFNLKYKRSGSLFENRYKASRIDTQAYLEHISRYIHLNPRSWKTYPYSSLTYYKRGNAPVWLHPQRILEMFNSSESYLQFVADYEEHRDMLSEIKHELADR
ncbi:MAG: transposase [Patescibacteria group bacterium]